MADIGLNPVYRICRVCGREWNVSRLEPGDKIYICPHCTKKRTAPGAATSEAVKKRPTGMGRDYYTPSDCKMQGGLENGNHKKD